MKTCRTCKYRKPLEAFQKNKSTYDGFTPSCAECTNARQRAYRKAQRKKARESKTTQSWKLSKGGFDKQAKEQGYICPICQKEKKLVQDHCHTKLEFRGLICQGCNVALGLMADNPRIFRRAARYLEKGL